MKLKPEYKSHQELYNQVIKQNVLFDPLEQKFFVSPGATFKKPEGYEHWTVEETDFKQYCSDRLAELGISDELNTIELITDQGERIPEPVFYANSVGDIEMLQYSIRREYYTAMSKGNENTSAVNRLRYYFQKRLHPLHEDIMDGKYDFTEADVVPFWPKPVVETFEAGEEVETLIITEGQFKAMKAAIDGIACCGLTSISHYRDKSSGHIHPEIIEFIRTMNVKKVVVLWDGDCRWISQAALDEGKDISKRPQLFYSSVSKIRDLLQKFFTPKALSIYFATINTAAIQGHPKGLDDLLVQINPERVRTDIANIGNLPGKLLTWIDITHQSELKGLRSFFHLTHVNEFYSAHQDQIGTRDFVYFGTTYRIERGMPVIKVSANVKSYKRIGPDYFRLIKRGVYDNYGNLIREEDELVPWKKDEIKQDHGKDILAHIEKYIGFENVASHTNFQQVIDGKWNLYYEVKHDVRSGEWPHIELLLRHLFEEQYEMVLDYLTVLYTMPYQKLPVVCLISKEEGTGKSTFIQLLQAIFQKNMAVISSDDITGNWSSHWISKLIVASEETFLDKKEAMEKIKAVSTADTWMRSERFVSSSAISCIVKFVFCSNHEEDFMKLTKQSSRFWVRKVKTIRQEITDMKDRLNEELPFFLHALLNREIVNPKKSRMWFTRDQIRTDAFMRVVANSEPWQIKELRIRLNEEFLKWGVKTIRIAVVDMKKYWGITGEVFYLNKIIQEYLPHDKKTDNEGNDAVSTYSFYIDNPADPGQPYVMKAKGRFYIFSRADFVKKTEQTDLFEQAVEEDDLPF